MYNSKYEVGKEYAGKYHVTRVSIKETDEPKYVWYKEGNKHFRVKEEDFAKLIGGSSEVKDIPDNVNPGIAKRRDTLRKRYVDGYFGKEKVKQLEQEAVEKHLKSEKLKKQDGKGK